MLSLKRKIVLASKSPRRRELLKAVGLKFSVRSSSFCELEHCRRGMSPADVAVFNACGKASDIARRFQNTVVIGVDTIGVLRGKVFGKPKDDAHAKKILRMLSGTTHEVISALCVIDTGNGKRMTAFERTYVTFDRMTDKEINAYVASGEQKDKAAAFAIQGLGSLFIKKINGDYFNVVGLPLFRLGKMLKKI